MNAARPLRRIKPEHPLIYRIAPAVILLAGWVGGALLTRHPAAFHAAVLSSLATGRWITASGTLDVVPFSTPVLVLIAVFTDTCIAAFIALNADVLRAIPWVGPRLRLLQLRSRKLLDERRVLRGAATVALFIFVVQPFPGTGSMGGTLLARSLGLSLRRTLIVVGLAITTGTLLIAYSAELIAWLIAARPGEHVAWLIVRFAVIAVLLAALAAWGQRAMRKSATDRTRRDRASRASLGEAR